MRVIIETIGRALLIASIMITMAQLGINGELVLTKISIMMMTIWVMVPLINHTIS